MRDAWPSADQRIDERCSGGDGREARASSSWSSTSRDSGHEEPAATLGRKSRAWSVRQGHFRGTEISRDCRACRWTRAAASASSRRLLLFSAQKSRQICRLHASCLCLGCCLASAPLPGATATAPACGVHLRPQPVRRAGTAACALFPARAAAAPPLAPPAPGQISEASPPAHLPAGPRRGHARKLLKQAHSGHSGPLAHPLSFHLSRSLPHPPALLPPWLPSPMPLHRRAPCART